MTPRLELLIEDYYREVVSVIKSFPLTGNRISKVFNSQIHKLEKVNEQFVSNFQRELLGMGAHRKRVEFVLSWLTEDIKYFVNEFNATYSSIPVEFSEHGEIMPPSWIHIPNRSSDQKRKKKFKEFIESCKESDGSLKKYPRHKTVQLFMNRAGFEFPDRTYRLYKQQIKNGTFDNFIQ